MHLEQQIITYLLMNLTRILTSSPQNLINPKKRLIPLIQRLRTRFW